MKNIFYYPDMVLSLDVKFDEKREGILTCFRSDKEKILSDEVINKINSCAEKNGIRIRPTSTVLDKNVGIADRENEVYEKLREFASAKLVITDRLHGMIFASIVGTPRLAFDTSTQKVSGVYSSWIKNDNVMLYDQKRKIDEQVMNFRTKDFELINNEIKVSAPTTKDSDRYLIIICKFIVGKNDIIFQDEEISKEDKIKYKENYDTIVRIINKPNNK
jgi:exopolysaccharide biosynthesis predicted pyruvyltransferase EpsI